MEHHLLIYGARHMTTLIAVYTSSGCIGRCDAKCYDAQSSDCDCICGGRNHGAGLAHASETTQAMVDTWLDRYHTEKGLDPSNTHTYCHVDQQSLLEMDLLKMVSISCKVRSAA